MGSIDKKIEDNMGLVYKQLHRFHLTKDDEAYSFAMEALWHAVETFDSEKGYMFSTYASVCIYNALGRYVRHLNRKRKLDVVSYNQIIEGGDSDIEFEYFFGDTSSDPERQLLLSELKAYMHQVIQEEHEKLSGNSYEIIEAWIASEYKIKQSELAKRVGTTQASVSRIISVFKYKLKRRLEEYQC